ncbi:MAG: LysR family transcriptional regulator [Lachnospiraceae bacterium]|nr:LysR family transcriptional regulator [Lachnospiraceae bacterium]
MNLNHLYYFKTLARVEHYTRAAQELSITQPSLSHAISCLEDELGTYLFEKQGRRVVLTKYGKVFLEYVTQSLDTLEIGIKKTRAMTSESSGIIDLGYIFTLGSHYVPRVVNDFLKAHEGKKIDFTFNQGITETVLEGLRDEKYDLAFCSHSSNQKNIDFIPVYQEEIKLVVPKGHPLALKESIRLEELAGYEQIYFRKGSGFRTFMDAEFRKVNVKPMIRYEVEEDSAMAGLVESGFGIAVMPDIPILQMMDVVTIPISEPTINRYIYLAKMKNKYLSPVALEFVHFVISNRNI